MGSRMYVGNLTYSVTNEQLRELFSTYGEVSQVNIIEGKGFGFVEMSTPDEANKAKEALKGTDFSGRTLMVDEARPPKSRDERGGGGYGGGRGGDRDRDSQPRREFRRF
ncbi:RNA-binding protein [Candidatus Desantisbacteria bacterium]|nr:RNA-binding protein [Candidatus Desantisbacteria bacterium]